MNSHEVFTVKAQIDLTLDIKEVSRAHYHCIVVK